MKLKIIKQKEREEELALQKVENQKVMNKQVEHVNAQHKYVLAERVREEKQLDLNIVKYQKSKDRKEFERLADEKASRDERERETQKLREQQEKVADRQADIDAIRARRAMEDFDRGERLKEKLKREKHE